VFQAGLEAVDQYARRPQTRELDDRVVANREPTAKRQLLQSKALGRDIFAKLAGMNVEAVVPHRQQQFFADQMNLPQIGKPGMAAREIPMLYVRARMRIALDAMTFNEIDAGSNALAEMMPRIERHGANGALSSRLRYFETRWRQ